jgi:aspartokinase
MRILVQKFGGTSVRSSEARAAAIDKVIAAKKSGYTPVVVVSAMGRAGEPYATDTSFSSKHPVCAHSTIGSSFFSRSATRPQRR